MRLVHVSDGPLPCSHEGLHEANLGREPFGFKGLWGLKSGRVSGRQRRLPPKSRWPPCYPISKFCIPPGTEIECRPFGRRRDGAESPQMATVAEYRRAAWDRLKLAEATANAAT